MDRKFLAAAGGCGALAGAILMFVFDPQRGRTRRAKARDQVFGLTRRGGKRLRRTGRKLRSDIGGLGRRVVHRDGVKVFDDVTLAEKVKTVLFSHPEAKGRVSVNVQDGVAVLRGAVDTLDQINDIPHIVADVPGVLGVENLLRIKGAPAPKYMPGYETAGHSDGSHR
jgi:BON domain-containing protein